MGSVAPALGAYVGTWFWQNPIPQGRSVARADFAGDTGWAVGNRTVLRTLNGGAQWGKQYAMPGADSANFVDVDAVDSNVTWIVATDGLVLRSLDGGTTWENRVPAGASQPTAIKFLNASEGWLGDSAGGLFRTTDGGDSWQLVSDLGSIYRMDVSGGRLLINAGTTIFTVTSGSDVVTPLGKMSELANSVSFYDGQHGIAVTYMGNYSRTSDGGKTWTRSRPIDRQAIDVTTVKCVSALTAYAFSSTDVVWKTSDGGATWTRFRPKYINRAGSAVSPRVEVRDVVSAPGRLILLGGDGAIMYSLDKGLSWRYITGDFFDRLVDVSFESPRDGLALAEKGAYRTSDGGATWSRRALPTQPKFSGITVRYPADQTFSAISVGANHVGWAVGSVKISAEPYNIGVVYRTSDAGRTFSQSSVPRSTLLYDVWTNDGVKAWASGLARPGASGFLMRTVNGGASWTRSTIDWSGATFAYPTEDRPITSVVVGESGIGYAKVDTSEGYVLRTIDDGASWHLAPFRNATTLSMVDSSTVIVGGQYGGITRYGYPSGATPLGSLPSSWEGATDIRFVNETVGYAAIASQIFRTDNGGASWTSAWSGNRIEKLAVAGDTDAWAVGYGGTIVYNGGVNGDFVPPVTRTSVPIGWQDGDAFVSLTANDQTGIDSTWWAIGEPPVAPPVDSPAMAPSALTAPLAYVPYKGKIRVTREGVTPITFYSRDVNGNFEAPRTVRVAIDRLAPVVTSDAKASYGGSAAVKISAEDAGSGVRALFFSVDGGATRTYYTSTVTVKRGLGLGAHSIVYWSKDRLGHVSRKVTKRFYVKPLAVVSAPSLPTTSTAGTAFKVSGYLSPRHKSAAKVVIRAYRDVDGVWTAGPVYTTSTVNTTAGSRYSALATLPSEGRWRFVAIHYDAGHYYSVSPSSYTTCVAASLP